mgnify:CR=1 FL=1
MRTTMLAAVAFAVAAGANPASAQQRPASPAADSAASAGVLALPRALPPALVPAREVRESDVAWRTCALSKAAKPKA